MATYRGITVDIEFNGKTSKFNEAVKEINDDLKKIDKQMNQVNKGLKLDPTNTRLLEQKFDLLSKKIETTQDKLKLLKKAEKEVEEQFKAGNIDKSLWEDFQKEIGKTEAELKKLKNEAADTVKAIGEDLSRSINELAGGLKTAAATITAIVTALGGLTMSAGIAADNINTLSKVTGISTEELQRFQYASSLIDVSQETLTGSLKKLTMNMQSAKDETGNAYEAFKTLGIQFKDSAGNLRNNKEVFYEVIDALGRISNETERDAYAMNIFGRSAQELNPLILAGSDALEDLGDQAQALGLVFDQATLDKLNAFNDKVDISKQKLNGMKTIIGAELVDSFERLFGGVDDLLKLVQKAQKDGTLAEIADGAALSLKGLMSVLGSAARFVYRFREEIAAGAKVFIAFKAALELSKLINTSVKALDGYEAAIKGVAAASGEAAAAQTAQNSAMSLGVSAIGAIGGAAIAAASAFAAYVASIDVTADATEHLSKQTQEFVEKNQELTSSVYDSISSNEEGISALQQQEAQCRALADTIYELAAKEELSDGEKQQLLAHIDALNKAVPGLNMSFDETSNSLSMQRAELEKLITAYEDYMELQARTEYGVELEKQRITAKSAYDEAVKQRDDAQKRYNELVKAEREAERKANEAGLAGEYVKQWKAVQSELETARDDLTAYNNTVVGLSLSLQSLDEKSESNKVSMEELSEKTEEQSETISQLTEDNEELADSAETLNTAEEKAKQTQEALTNAYSSAKSSVGTYRSELANLISVLDQVNAGTAYSTTQMLELIEKYPELAKHIKETADGYVVETNAVKELLKAKAQNMLQSSEEQKQLLGQQMYYAKTNQMGFNSSQFAEMYEQWKLLGDQIERYQMIVDNIGDGKIYQGHTPTETTVSTTPTAAAVTSVKETAKKEDTTDYLKKTAEAEISEAEHLYSMGELSAEEYYSRLDEINKRYYENKAEYLEEYRKLEEKVYSGLKKAQEDELSNAKDLEDRLAAVKKAQDELQRAEAQQVQVYSLSAGFHAEKNTSAIESAQSSLNDSKYSLAQLLLKLGKYNGESLSQRLGSINISSLRAMLPDLSNITLPSSSGGVTNNSSVSNDNRTTSSTSSITYAPQIIIQGSVDERTLAKLRKTLREDWKKFMNEYLSSADRTRQTGG